jgi:uncharacterized protein YggE
MGTDNHTRRMTVTGVGQVTAPPDLLLLNLAAETEAATTSDALKENNKQVSNVLSALKDHGIHKGDIQTTELRIDPVTEQRKPNDTSTPKIIGYRVRNALDAKLRDIQGAGTVIDAAVEAGGDASRIDSISFSYADPSKLLSEARKKAMNDAKDRAQQLATGLGARLGPIISISESDQNGPPVRRFTHAAFAETTPVLPGESTVTHQVTISYEISTM